MKIIKEKTDSEPIAVTFRLPKNVVNEVTRVAKSNGISRQKLVTAILEQAINDKNFKLKIRD